MRAHPAFAELERSIDRNRRDLDRVRDVDLARARDRALDRVHLLDTGLTGLDNMLTDLDDVLSDLDDALHDFTTADLRGVDLSRVQLEGLRWSSATQWPADDRVAKIKLDSVELAPGVFEVRSGGVYATTPV